MAEDELGSQRPKRRGRADRSPIRRSPSIDGHEVVPGHKASAHPEAECSS